MQLTWLLWWVCALAHSRTASTQLLCQNGGTFNDLRYECVCTPFYFGRMCENSFDESNPCQQLASIPVLRDMAGTHRLSNTDDCRRSSSCVAFNTIQPGWYRLLSPAGNELVSSCPTSSIACGSRKPFILTNITKEENNNLALYSARAYQYRRRPGARKCYFEDSTSYPVRIAVCSSQVKLYYLQQLPSSSMHYCIGSIRVCGPGMRSVDGTGYEPCVPDTACSPTVNASAVKPQLRLDFDIFEPIFRCTLLSAFSSIGTVRLRHFVRFVLTRRNGTSTTVCERRGVEIPAGGNVTVECDRSRVLLPSDNVYGATLTCQLQASCGQPEVENYNSPLLESNAHSLSFDFFFRNSSDVIRPEEPVELCVDVRRVPADEMITFFVSVGRQHVISNDRIDITALRRDGIDSLECGMSIMSMSRRTVVCQEFILLNRDPNGRIPLGLTHAQQISIIKINVSYSSDADGIYTRNAKGDKFSEQAQRVELKVDLSGLQNDMKTYMHVYFGLYVKTADAAYANSAVQVLPPGVVNSRRRNNFIALRHKLLPYEFQFKVYKPWANRRQSGVEQVALRYGYYVIYIFGEPRSRLTYRVTEKLPAGVCVNPIPRQQESDLPVGVRLENVGKIMKIQLDLYGTIMFVWGFSTAATACGGNFLPTAEQMLKRCSGEPDVYDNRWMLSVSIVPGFYDTKRDVEGLVYSNGRPLNIDEHRPTEYENLFSQWYQMKKMPKDRRQPTEALSICDCNGERQLTSNCFVNFNEVTRERRSLRQPQPTLTRPPLPSTPPTPTTDTEALSQQISEEEAADFCATFAELKKQSMVSARICAATKDVTGQSDYVTQFRTVCAQYAHVLGTYKHTQSLFSAILGMCYTEMTYNATVMRTNESAKVEVIVEDLCPANCSGNGDCVSGECQCREGFSGHSCEYETKTLVSLPTTISLLGREQRCSSANCRALFVIVRPVLKSASPRCVLATAPNDTVDDTGGDPSASEESPDFSRPAVFISGDIVRCDVADAFRWLKRRSRIYLRLLLRLEAADWQSDNTLPVLLHRDV